jgi:hypothetical protein
MAAREAAREAIIGEEWKERSRELADWAMDRLMMELG